MPLIYTVISRGVVVLAEYASARGNFDQVARRILEKIPTNANSKMSYVFERHVFHYMVDDGLIYLCMADEAFGRRVPFTFLEDLKGRFRAGYGDRGKQALAFQMNEDFSRVMKNLMDYYNSNPESDKINKLKGEVDEVKNIMVQNIGRIQSNFNNKKERVLERGERIELLVDKTETLSSNAFKFKKQSTALKRAMWWKNVKLIIIIVVIVLIIIYVIVAIVCGGPALKGCIKAGKNIKN